MYGHITNPGVLASPVQTEPEDLSPHPSSATSSRSSSVGPGAGPLMVNTNKLLWFCDIVLKHVNYPHAFLEPCGDENESSEDTKSHLTKNERATGSPLNSVGESARESTRSSTTSTESVLAELDAEDSEKAAYESVSCWCGKPYAGRPMIECESCFVWFHLSCEKVHRNNIPDDFHCSRCREKWRRKGRPHPKEGSSRKNGSKKRKAPSSATSSRVPTLDSPGRSPPSHLGNFISSPASPLRSEELKSSGGRSSSPTGIMHELLSSTPPVLTRAVTPPNLGSSNHVGNKHAIKSAERRSSVGSPSHSRPKKSRSLGSGEEGRGKSEGGATYQRSNFASTTTNGSMSTYVLTSVGLNGDASSRGVDHVPSCPPPMLPYNPPRSDHIGVVAAVPSTRNERVFGDLAVSSPLKSFTTLAHHVTALPVVGPSEGVILSPERSPPAISLLRDHHHPASLQYQGESFKYHLDNSTHSPSPYMVGASNHYRQGS